MIRHNTFDLKLSIKIMESSEQRHVAQQSERVTDKKVLPQNGSSARGLCREILGTFPECTKFHELPRSLSVMFIIDLVRYLLRSLWATFVICNVHYTLLPL